MKNFFTYDAVGRIHCSGTCQDEDLVHQAGAGLLVMEGSASVFLNYIDGRIVKSKPTQPSAFHAFDYTLKQWIDPRTLQDHKDAKWQSIKQARAAATYAPLATSFGTFDANETSRFSIERAAFLAERTNTAVAFTLNDDAVVMLDAAALNQVSLMLGQREQAARNKATSLRARIASATTAAALNLIVW